MSSETAHAAGGDANPHTTENTTDAERADMLAEYLDQLTDEFGATPRLMPLDTEGKGPIIQGTCGLDTEQAREYLTDGDDAVRQIREDGARGFAIYAGKPEHNTEGLVLVDVDDRETFPYEDFPATLMVLSGSARGEHFTYRNGGDVSNASGKDGVDGEVRAHNWFCVTPGSIHPSGGVYHIHKDMAIETLLAEDIPTALRPASDRRDTAAAVDEYDPDPTADVKAVTRRHTWIAEYLAGLLDNPDRSKKDFAACRAFAAAGVAEDDARAVLANSPASKVGSTDASSSYWSETWTNALTKEATDDDGDGDGSAGLPDPAPSFDRHNGGYGYWSSGGEDAPDEWTEWTNFELEVESFLTLEDGSEEIELTVHPRHGDAYTVTVSPRAFNEKRAFKDEVACGRSTTFTGGETPLARIKQFVGTRDVSELQGVRHMGRHADELVLPDGTLTAGGWDADPTRRYLKQSVGLERKVLLTQANDVVDSNDTGSDDDGDAEAEVEADADVRQILELLPETREPERFLPALGWFYATPLRPIITDLTGEFPVLSITGGTGAGKTSTLETLWALLGVGGDPFSANDTTFTAMKTLSTTDTFPVWFDEYKPSDIHPGRLDGFHDLVRKSTRGGVVSKGNADQTTTEYHLQAPVVVSGEQRFAGPAEQRRSILTTFREATTDPEGEYARAFAELVGGSYRDPETGAIEHYDGLEPAAHAFAYHRWLLGYDRGEITDAWRNAETRVLSLLDEYGLGNVDSAGRTALQTIVFGLGLYRAFADDVGATDPLEREDINRAITYVAKQQGNDGRRESHLDEFVRYLALAAMDTELEEDRHYTRVYKRDGESEIRVNMGRAYPKVARYVQNHGLANRAELLGEGDYRERIKEAAGEDGSYVTTYSQNSPPVGRAFGLHLSRASAAVEAFDGEHFYGRDEQGENGRYPSDRDPHEEHWRSEQ